MALMSLWKQTYWGTIFFALNKRNKIFDFLPSFSFTSSLQYGIQKAFFSDCRMLIFKRLSIIFNNEGVLQRSWRRICAQVKQPQGQAWANFCCCKSWRKTVRSPSYSMPQGQVVTELSCSVSHSDAMRLIALTSL